MRQLIQLRLRQALECQACGQYIDAVADNVVPRDLPDGGVSVVGCIALGICPVCRTQSEGEFSIDTLRRMALVLKSRKRHMRRASCSN